MRLALAALGILGGLLGAALPARAQRAWDQAYGNLANNSMVNATTNLPVAPRWAFQLDGAVSAGGPSVDPKSGTIYVGTAKGTLWGFLPTGDFHCSRSFKGETITSTPAIFPNGDVAILVSRPDGERWQTSLARLSANCGLIWQFDLPRTRLSPSTATGSVKIWTLNGTSFLFVHARNSIDLDLTLPEPISSHELLVFDGTGLLFARRRVGDECIRVGGGVGDFPHRGPYHDIWEILSSFWPVAGSPLYETYGWPDSTPAILDTALKGYATPSSPLVAVTDDNCTVRLEILQFDPAAGPSFRLVKRWGDNAEEYLTLLSSPAVTWDGLVAFGTSGHRVRVYDLNTHSLKWSYDTKHPVMHPPAMAFDAWIVPSDKLVHFLKPNTGGLLGTARPQPVPVDGLAGGLAASLNEVVVPHFDELGIWTHDLINMTHALTNENFRTSSPALTPEGRLYVVAQTNELSVLFGFGPP
jgi:hypothetical protein